MFACKTLTLLFAICLIASCSARPQEPADAIIPELSRGPEKMVARAATLGSLVQAGVRMLPGDEYPVHIPAVNYKRTAFYARIRIGASKEPFLLNLDTGSGRLWVASRGAVFKGLDGKVRKPTWPEYDSAQGTLLATNPPWSQKYGAGFAEGEYAVIDTIRVDARVLGKFRLFLADSLSFPSVWVRAHQSGFIGLAPGNAFMDRIIKAGAPPKFSVWLPRVGNGEFTVGGENPARYTGMKTSEIPVDRSRGLFGDVSWLIKLERGGVQLEGISLDPSSHYVAHLDTGATPFMFVKNSKTYQAFKKRMTSIGAEAFSLGPTLPTAFVIPGSSLNQLPEMQFKVQGQTLTIDAEGYTYTGDALLGVFASATPETLAAIDKIDKPAVVMVVAVDVLPWGDGNGMLLGTVFFSTYYTIFTESSSSGLASVSFAKASKS